MKVFVVLCIIVCCNALSFKISGRPSIKPEYRERIEHAMRTRGFSSPLTGGDTDAAYFVELKLGTPAQVIRMDPDTGSSVFGVLSPAVVSCSHFKQGYDPSISSTATQNTCGSTCAAATQLSCANCELNGGACGTCTVDLNYGDGSEGRGSVYTDILSGADGKKYQVYVASITYAIKHFCNTNDDGILGLANGQLAYGVPTFMDQLASQGMANKLAFCFGRFDHGLLFLGGGEDQYVAPGSYRYVVGMDMSQGFYGIAPQEVRIADSSFGLSNVNAIVDSGTTLLITQDYTFYSWIKNEVYVLAGALNAKDKALVQRIVLGSVICVNKEDLSFLPCMPDIQIGFADLQGKPVFISVPASSYFWINTYANCLAQGYDYGVMFGIQYGFLGSIDMILGDVFMRNVITTFDRDASGYVFQQPLSTACGDDLVNITDGHCSYKPVFPNTNNSQPVGRFTTTMSRHTTWTPTNPPWQTGPPNQPPIIGSLGLPIWAIVVIALGGVAVVSTLIAFCCCCSNNSKRTPGYYQVPGGSVQYPGGSAQYTPVASNLQDMSGGNAPQNVVGLSK